MQRFLHIEAAGGLPLIACAVMALVWATELTLDLGDHAITDDLRHWINDGLMTLFFFVIGLEIKQKLTNGQLTTPATPPSPLPGRWAGF